MNRKEAKELLPIIQAFAEGKQLQIYGDYEWTDINSDTIFWDDNPENYRVKPEPRVLWVYPMGNNEFEATTIKENTKHSIGVFKAIEVLEDD